jgi:hypothetical protein
MILRHRHGTGARGGSHRPRAELEVIEDGHLFMVTRPHETAKRSEKFLSGAL